MGHVAIGDATKNSDFRWSDAELVLRRMILISSILPVDLVNFLCRGFFTRFELNNPNFFVKFCTEPLEDEKSELMDVESCQEQRIKDYKKWCKFRLLRTNLFAATHI